MARNESIIAIPASVEDPVVLRRVLSKIVESLDIAVGNRDSYSAQYVTKKAFDTAVAALEKVIATAVANSNSNSAVSKSHLDQQQLNSLGITVEQNKGKITTNINDIRDLDDAITINTNNITAISNSLIANPVTSRMCWLGAWSAGSYLANDVVKDLGTTWIALVDTSSTPGVDATWESLT